MTTALQLPASLDWIHGTEPTTATRAYLQALLGLTENPPEPDPATNAFAPGSAVARASVALGLDTPDQWGRARSILQLQWTAAPELKRVRRAVMAALRDPDSPCQSLTSAAALADHLHRHQLSPVEGGRVGIAMMLRCLLEVTDGAAFRQLGARRITDTDLLIAANKTPFTEGNGYWTLRGALDTGYQATQLGSLMYGGDPVYVYDDRESGLRARWEHQRSADLADRINRCDRDLAELFDYQDAWVPEVERRSLSHLEPLAEHDPRLLARLVAASAPRADYQADFDVLYDARIRPQTAMLVAFNRAEATVGDLLDRLDPGPVLAAHLLGLIRDVFPAAVGLDRWTSGTDLSASAAFYCRDRHAPVVAGTGAVGAPRAQSVESDPVQQTAIRRGRR